MGLDPGRWPAGMKRTVFLPPSPNDDGPSIRQAAIEQRMELWVLDAMESVQGLDAPTDWSRDGTRLVVPCRTHSPPRTLHDAVVATRALFRITSDLAAVGLVHRRLAEDTIWYNPVTEETRLLSANDWVVPKSNNVHPVNCVWRLFEQHDQELADLLRTFWDSDQFEAMVDRKVLQNWQRFAAH